MTFEELYNLIQQNLENLTNITAKGKTIYYQLHLKKNKFILDKLEKFLKENPNYKNIHILWKTLIENNPLKKCLNPNCNNYLTRRQQRIGQLYCCAKCKNTSPIYKENLKKGVRLKYRG